LVCYFPLCQRGKKGDLASTTGERGGLNFVP